MDLFEAAEAGDLERVQILVKQGEDVEQTDSEGRTPLFAASRCGHLPVVQFLIEQQTAKRRGRFLFKLASSFLLSFSLLLLFVFLLIALGWSMLSQSFPKYTAVIDNLTWLQLLVKEARNLAEEMLRTLFTTISNIKTDKSYETPVNVASGNGHLAVVRFILEQQPSQIDLSNTNGWTPLIHAATKGHIDVVRYLNEQEANRDETDNFGMTALNRASCNGHLEIVRYLVEQGANIEKADKQGWTPLIWATCSDRVEVVRYLLVQGADRDKAELFNGSTPLHYAVKRGQLEIAKLLMAYGADLNARNFQGRLPIDEADWNDELFGDLPIELARINEEIKQAIRDEPRRRMDHGHKRATEQDRHRNAATSPSSQLEETEAEEGKVAE